MEFVNESTLRRIQKLLAIANDARGDANECAAAAEMANKLMRKYNIDHADLLTAKIKNQEQAFKVLLKPIDPKKPTSKTPSWAGFLGFRIAKLFDCEVRFERSKSMGECMAFFGTDEDTQVCGWMFDYIINQLRIGMLRYQNCGISRTRGQTDSYRVAFVMGVCDNLKALQDERHKAEAAPEGKQVYALVVAKADAIKQAFGEFKYGEGKQINWKDVSAASQGYAAGQKVNVNSRGLPGDKSESAAQLN